MSSLSLIYFLGVKVRGGISLTVYYIRRVSTHEQKRKKIKQNKNYNNNDNNNSTIDRENPASGNYYGGNTARRGNY